MKKKTPDPNNYLSLITEFAEREAWEPFVETIKKRAIEIQKYEKKRLIVGAQEVPMVIDKYLKDLTTVMTTTRPNDFRTNEKAQEGIMQLWRSNETDVTAITHVVWYIVFDKLKKYITEE